MPHSKTAGLSSEGPAAFCVCGTMSRRATARRSVRQSRECALELGYEALVQRGDRGLERGVRSKRADLGDLAEISFHRVVLRPGTIMIVLRPGTHDCQVGANLSHLHIYGDF